MAAGLCAPLIVGRRAAWLHGSTEAFPPGPIGLRRNDPQADARHADLVSVKARGSDEAGAALLEFAIVLPLLMVLVFGVVDLGRAYRLKTRLTNAAREGAAYAQYFPSQVDSSGPGCADPNSVSFTSTHEEGASNGFTITVANASAAGAPILGCNATTITPGTRVVVVASAPFTLVTPALAAFVPNGTMLHGRSEVMVQG